MYPLIVYWFRAQWQPFLFCIKLELSGILLFFFRQASPQPDLVSAAFPMQYIAVDVRERHFELDGGQFEHGFEPFEHLKAAPLAIAPAEYFNVRPVARDEHIMLHAIELLVERPFLPSAPGESTSAITTGSDKCTAPGSSGPQRTITSGKTCKSRSFSLSQNVSPNGRHGEPRRENRSSWQRRCFERSSCALSAPQPFRERHVRRSAPISHPRGMSRMRSSKSSADIVSNLKGRFGIVCSFPDIEHLVDVWLENSPIAAAPIAAGPMAASSSFPLRRFG